MMLQDRKVVESLPVDYWQDEPLQEEGVPGYDYRDRWNKFQNQNNQVVILCFVYPIKRGMWRKTYNFCSIQFYTMMP